MKWFVDVSQLVGVASWAAKGSLSLRNGSRIGRMASVPVASPTYYTVVMWLCAVGWNGLKRLGLFVRAEEIDDVEVKHVVGSNWLEYVYNVVDD